MAVAGYDWGRQTSSYSVVSLPCRCPATFTHHRLADCYLTIVSFSDIIIV